MSIATYQVRVYNASYQELGPTTLDRAMMLVEVKGRAEVIEYDEERVIRTVGGREFFLPKIIRLLSMAKVGFHYGPETFTRDGLIRRDNNTCGYCGVKAYGEDITHDHIIPRSKGGEDSWMNAIAACRKCNGKKDNRTPQEAGMTLLWEPWVPKKMFITSDKPRRRKKKH